MQQYSSGEKAGEIRRLVIEMCANAGSGHCGGSLSAAEVLSVLYFEKMNIKPELPDWEERDRFIASKGHSAPAVYAVLAMRGYFDIEELMSLRKVGSKLQGHPDMQKLAGIDMSTGSLGMGLSNAIGIGLSARHLKKNYHCYVLLGDGETQEGQIWEAAMCAAKFGVDNITVILDKNGVQLDGTVDDIMPPGDIEAKWKAFGWEVFSCNGHDTTDISRTLDLAKMVKGVPSIVIAHTVKGKGVSFMEGDYRWHGRPLTENERKVALEELARGGVKGE